MSEIEVTPSSQGGITNQQRGLPVEPLAGYELKSKPDVKKYSYTSDKEVITRSGPKKISEIGLIGVEETTRTYKPIGESYPNIIETEEKPIFGIQSEERGIANRLIKKEPFPYTKVKKPELVQPVEQVPIKISKTSKKQESFKKSVNILQIDPLMPAEDYPVSLDIPEYLVKELVDLQKDMVVLTTEGEKKIERCSIITNHGKNVPLEKEDHIELLNLYKYDPQHHSPRTEEVIKKLREQGKLRPTDQTSIYVHTHWSERGFEPSFPEFSRRFEQPTEFGDILILANYSKDPSLSNKKAFNVHIVVTKEDIYLMINTKETKIAVTQGFYFYEPSDPTDESVISAIRFGVLIYWYDKGAGKFFQRAGPKGPYWFRK